VSSVCEFLKGGAAAEDFVVGVCDYCENVHAVSRDRVNLAKRLDPRKGIRVVKHRLAHQGQLTRI
jgi:hypothetical protein